MSIAQIGAIISLLLAFNVPQPTVDTVQTILLDANKAQIGIPAMPSIEEQIAQIDTEISRLKSEQEAKMSDAIKRPWLVGSQFGLIPQGPGALQARAFVKAQYDKLIKEQEDKKSALLSQ